MHVNARVGCEVFPLRQTWSVISGVPGLNQFDCNQEGNPLLCMYRKSEASTPKLVQIVSSFEALSSVLVCQLQFHLRTSSSQPLRPVPKMSVQSTI